MIKKQLSAAIFLASIFLNPAFAENDSRDNLSCHSIASGNSSAPYTRSSSEKNSSQTVKSAMTVEQQQQLVEVFIEYNLENFEVFQIKELLQTIETMSKPEHRKKAAKKVGVDYLDARNAKAIFNQLAQRISDYDIEQLVFVTQYFYSKPTEFNFFFKRLKQLAKGKLEGLTPEVLAVFTRLLDRAMKLESESVHLELAKELFAAIAPQMEDFTQQQKMTLAAAMSYLPVLPSAGWMDQFADKILQLKDDYDEALVLSPNIRIRFRYSMLRYPESYSEDFRAKYKNHFLHFLENFETWNDGFVTLLQFAKSRDLLLEPEEILYLRGQVLKFAAEHYKSLHISSLLLKELVGYGWMPDAQFLKTWNRFTRNFAKFASYRSEKVRKTKIVIFQTYAEMGELPPEEFLQTFSNDLYYQINRVEAEEAFDLLKNMFTMKAEDYFASTLKTLRDLVINWRYVPPHLFWQLKFISTYRATFRSDLDLQRNIHFDGARLGESKLTFDREIPEDLFEALQKMDPSMQRNYRLPSGVVASLYSESAKRIIFFQHRRQYFVDFNGNKSLRPFERMMDELHKELGFSTSRIDPFVLAKKMNIEIDRP